MTWDQREAHGQELWVTDPSVASQTASDQTEEMCLVDQDSDHTLLFGDTAVRGPNMKSWSKLETIPVIRSMYVMSR